MDDIQSATGHRSGRRSAQVASRHSLGASAAVLNPGPRLTELRQASARFWRRQPLAASLLLAIVIHLVILAIHFGHSRPVHRPQPLEITLNAPHADRTRDASPDPARIQGEVPADPRLSSQVGNPAQKQANPHKGPGPITSGRAGAVVSPRQTPAPDSFDLLNEKVRRSLQTGYMTSRDKNGPAGRYMARWKHQVENYGNSHYPDALIARNLSGRLTLEVTIDQLGHVLNIAIRRSSGNSAIDHAARRIVQLAAPYPPFPPELAREYKQLVITRTWLFSSGNHLVTH